ncbi:MAG: glutamate racemase [Parcubacteria group bacterium]|nr:glutamate racemase [Parcubacteria group bacterium]
MAQQKKGGSIGIFDSGFGGLHVLRSITESLPQYNYIYLGDTARMPYGTRSQDEVYTFTKQAVDFLFKNDCELVILACYTASSTALRKIQQQYLPQKYLDKNVLGVLIPTIEDAVISTKNKKIGVLATEGTVSSGAFTRELIKIDPAVIVFEKACPLLVPLVEAGEHNGQTTKDILRKYLSPLLEQGVDTLILGCTHYGILKNQIRDITGPSVSIIESSSSLPLKLHQYLENHPEIEKKLGKKGASIFYSTGVTSRFQALGSQFFGKNIKVQKAFLN